MFIATLFLILVLLIVLLSFQIYENNSRFKEDARSDQEQLKMASRFLIQSATDDHPLLKKEHVMRAKIILEDIIRRNNGLINAEKVLRLDKGRLNEIIEQANQQDGEINSFLMTKIIEYNSRYDTSLNKEAGFRRRKIRSKKNMSRERKRS